MEKQVEVRQANGTAADPEVSARPRRRWFAAEFKMGILDEVDRVDEPGAVGAILRREGLYSSHLTQWRKERLRGTLSALSKKRGRKPTKNPLADENERLRKELARAKRELEQAKLVIEVQKKVASLLGIPLKTLDDDENAS